MLVDILRLPPLDQHKTVKTLAKRKDVKLGVRPPLKYYRALGKQSYK